MATSKIVLGYWNARSRGGAIRSLLAYCGIPFTNKTYNEDAEWFGQDKQNIGLDFPNLPYLIDGDKKLTETNAILFYIAIKAGKRELIGDTDEKFVKVQTALGVINDLRANYYKLLFTRGDAEAERKEAFTNGPLKAKLDVLNKNLEGKEWLCGFFSVADFELFEVVEGVDKMDSTQIDKYPNLAAHRKRFSEIPEYKAHRNSAEFIA